MKTMMNKCVRSILAAALAILLLAGAAVLPTEASAAGYLHNGRTFTVNSDQYLDAFFEAMGDEAIFYTADLVEGLSDSGYLFYDMHDEDGNSTMTLHIYNNWETKKVEAVRLDFDPTRCTEQQVEDNLEIMLIAYEITNGKMNNDKWNYMTSEETFSETYDGYGFFGEIDGVEFDLTISEDWISMIIE